MQLEEQTGPGRQALGGEHLESPFAHVEGPGLMRVAFRTVGPESVIGQPTGPADPGVLATIGNFFRHGVRVFRLFFDRPRWRSE